MRGRWRRGARTSGPGLLLVLLAATACATPGPRTFRFASNLAPAEGRACALAVLRRHGFGPAAASAGDSTVTVIRAPARTPQGPGEWWRAEVSLGTDEDGRTLITSAIGASDREAGPFTAPPERLQQIGSEITARCMWGSG